MPPAGRMSAEHPSVHTPAAASAWGFLLVSGGTSAVDMASVEWVQCHIVCATCRAPLQPCACLLDGAVELSTAEVALLIPVELVQVFSLLV